MFHALPPDHFLKVIVSRNDNPLFFNSPTQNVVVAHSWVFRANLNHIMA
jgi:hypothetical protein